MAETRQNDLVAIARIVRPRGLKGEMVAELLTDFPARFEELETTTLRDADGSTRTAALENFFFQNGRVVLKIAGVDTIEAAEQLRNADVCIDESQAVRLEADEFYDWQLEGCEVETIDGTKIGAVRELMRTGGTEVLVVAGDDRDHLIPFAAAICTDVDVDKKLIRIDPPEGLLEF